jgi:hypothetical protein
MWTPHLTSGPVTNGQTAQDNRQVTELVRLVEDIVEITEIKVGE